MVVEDASGNLWLGGAMGTNLYKITWDYVDIMDEVLQPLVDEAMLSGYSCREEWISAWLELWAEIELSDAIIESVLKEWRDEVFFLEMGFE
nr:RINT1-like protein MAG2 [Tanacetum cinerariifolium]